MPPHHPSLFAEPATWVAIAFVIFVVLFGRKLWTPLAAILDKRAEEIRGELAEASRLKREASRMLTEATQQRERAAADAKALIEGAQAEAARLSAAAAHEAERSAARREKMAHDRIAAAEKAAVTEVRLAATDIATRAAAAVMATTVDGPADAALIDGAIAGLPAALARRAA